MNEILTDLDDLVNELKTVAAQLTVDDKIAEADALLVFASTFAAVRSEIVDLLADL
jgi:hypothetical protein